MMEEKILRRRHMHNNRVEKAKYRRLHEKYPYFSVYRYAPELTKYGYYARKFRIESLMHREAHKQTKYEAIREGLNDYYDEKDYGYSDVANYYDKLSNIDDRDNLIWFQEQVLLYGGLERLYEE